MSYVNLNNIPQTEGFIRARSYSVQCTVGPCTTEKISYADMVILYFYEEPNSSPVDSLVQVPPGMIKMDERDGYMDEDEWHERRDSE